MPAGRTSDGDSTSSHVGLDDLEKTHLKSAADFRIHRERDLCYTYAVSGSRRNLVQSSCHLQRLYVNFASNDNHRSFFLIRIPFGSVRPFLVNKTSAGRKCLKKEKKI